MNVTDKCMVCVTHSFLSFSLLLTDPPRFVTAGRDGLLLWCLQPDCLEQTSVALGQEERPVTAGEMERECVQNFESKAYTQTPSCTHTRIHTKHIHTHARTHNTQ